MRLLLMLACVALMASPVQADEVQTTIPFVVQPEKVGFKYRHPKIYKNFRKVRAVCIFVGPVVNVAANCFTAVGVFF